MASSSQAKRLRKLASEIPSDFTTEATMQVLVEQNTDLADAAIVLLAGTLLDTALEAALLSKMRKLKDDERLGLFSYDKRGPLCDFSAKIKMGYALNIYGPKTKDDLDSIRIIRNHFAHPKKHFSFSESVIAEILDGMHYHTTITLLEKAGHPDNTKGRFLSTVTSLASTLKSDIEKYAGNKLVAALMQQRVLP